MKRMLLAVALAGLLVSACASPPTATRALEGLGLTDIVITGYRYWGCGEGDFYHTGFTAKNARGRVVSGVVCGGLFFKGSTVRFD